ncbi:helix-turn-helix domain-containing protein [Streptomyces sp. NPDC004267]|uniref:helix-turn-helix domain-containing protein n=1 Tax=Streptomyces sp. NPDC004267 TaxID=3364694 RepID=UPI00367B45AB
MSIAPARGWALERNDRRLVFASGPSGAMFAETGPFSVTAHRHPVWKVVLSPDGLVGTRLPGKRPVTSAGVIVPPRLLHTAGASSSYTALFLDPWKLPADLGLTHLDRAAVRRILAALDPSAVPGPDADLAAAAVELGTLTGAVHRLDPRVTHAIGESTRDTPPAEIGSIADNVGLSPARLRALVRTSVGVPLVQLRMWARLRTAVAALPGTSVAAAAASAGFSDQAHLTRTARSLLGRTPTSMKQAPTSRVL